MATKLIIFLLYFSIVNANNIENSMNSEKHFRNHKYLDQNGAILVNKNQDKFSNINDFAKINETNEDTARVGGGAVSPSIDGLALLYNANTGSGAGPCALINKKWALSSTMIVPGDITPGGLIIFTNVVSTANSDLTAKTRHRVREIKKHPLIFNYYSTIMIMRVCPDFPTPYVSLPPASKTYNMGYPATFVNFLPNLVGAKKGFTYSCECDDQNGWDPVRTLCLTANPYIYNGPNEKGSLLFVDGVFAGVNLWPTSMAGEPYADIAKYLEWLTNNTPAP